MVDRMPLTITKGSGLARRYVPRMPHSQMSPIGIARYGAIEGALVLDMSDGEYVLITKEGDRYALNQEDVRKLLAG
jgi:hypothetical protein